MQKNTSNHTIYKDLKTDILVMYTVASHHKIERRN